MFRLINLETIHSIEHALGYRFSSKEVNKLLRNYERDGPPKWLIEEEKKASRRKKEGQGSPRLFEQISSYEASSS